MPTSTATLPVRHFKMSKSLNESLAESGAPQEASDNGRHLEEAKKIRQEYITDMTAPKPKAGITFATQDKLPKLPIPELESSLRKYLRVLEPLQSPREHAETEQAVQEFLRGEGPELQERLKKYATGKTSYIEQFCRFMKSNDRVIANGRLQGTIHISISTTQLFSISTRSFCLKMALLQRETTRSHALLL